jgi:phosphotransferase system enzyme I (PtsI)
MNKSRVAGIAMDMGARTSHTAILARAFEIPAVLGLSDISRVARNGDEIIVDGAAGLVILNPDGPTRERYERARLSFRAHGQDLMVLSALPAVTLDGKHVFLTGNIEVPEEVDSLRIHGAEGIGLYRSEFLFLRPGILPSEEVQYNAYSRVLKAMQGRPVTIRTLDLGGDKLIPDYTDSDEKNPLLGWRAIRFCLARKPLFMIQLRALLRASVHGELRIMFPLVSGIEELDASLDLLEEARCELRRDGQPYREQVPAGCMIEVPAAAMTSDILARRVQFFSIGTNDLIQYTIAVDRGNQRTAYLYEPFHPGVLRLIKMTIDNAHAAGIPVSMCGEMAGDPSATLILLGMGLDEFSMSAAGIPEVKKVIRTTSLTEAEAVAAEVLAMTSFREIDARMAVLMKERFNVPG